MRVNFKNLSISLYIYHQSTSASPLPKPSKDATIIFDHDLQWNPFSKEQVESRKNNKNKRNRNKNRHQLLGDGDFDHILDVSSPSSDPESRAEQELFNLNRLIDPVLSSPEEDDEHSNDILLANGSRNILASESNIVPNAEPEFIIPKTNENSNNNKNNSSQPFYKQYEQIERSYTNNDHIISVNKNITEKDYTKLLNIIETNSKRTRSFDDFVKMAFWQAVLSESENGHKFNDIHQVNLDDSTTWWKKNFVNHGCYCWPEQEEKSTNLTNPNRLLDSQRISGFGQPRDPLDEECFDLYSCYRCVSLMPECKKIDWVTSHYDCQFLSTMKNLDGTNTTRLEIKCNDPDPCLQSLCECDKKFALNAKEKLKFKDDSNNKVFPDGCPRQGHEDSKKKCCGTWPNVKPYPIDDKCCSRDITKGGYSIFKIHDGICSAEDLNTDPSWEQLYEGSYVTLNKHNPNITDHDHSGSHINSDHIHPLTM